jgi:hypothetical protein
MNRIDRLARQIVIGVEHVPPVALGDRSTAGAAAVSPDDDRRTGRLCRTRVGVDAGEVDVLAVELRCR